MGEEDKTKKSEIIELIGEEVDKRLKNILSTAIIPKGYTRCAGCGAIIKLDSPCPYCEGTEVSEGDKADADMLNLFEDEGEEK